MNVSRRSGYVIGLDTETSQLTHKLAIINTFNMHYFSKLWSNKNRRKRVKIIMPVTDHYNWDRIDQLKSRIDFRKNLEEIIWILY